ncbi:carbohydrate kinase family protein [Sediminicola luteus]|uniref:Carbohydrate kinase family protein n=1 Tax=Sediminicola luteus TaxID=319238 RepID=A0ABV2TV20_9FLAO
MSNIPKVTVIGASNVDLIGLAKEKLIYEDSNVGSIDTILGGVGRNIAENLKHLGFDVDFLSVFADDEFSKTLKNSCKDLGISIEHSLTVKGSNTSLYVAIMDHYRDLALALSAMDIYDTIPDSFILEKLDVIAQNEFCVIETNLPVSILELVTEKLPNTKFALEAVSAKKALKAISIIDRLHILKCNAKEAELLSNMTVQYESDYEKIIEHFLGMGVKKVFITLGKDGVAYGDQNEIFINKNNILIPVNTIGAGDAFMAGLIYGETKGMDLYDMVNFGTGCAQITIQHKNAVHPEICEEMVLKTMQ